MSDEMGKLESHAKDEVELCAAIFDFTADNCADQLADEDAALDGCRAITSYRPIGIILGIQPFNFPIYQALRYSVPQLAAGNAVRQSTTSSGMASSRSSRR